ncbi:MAG: phospholipase D family protein [Planctomycetota bacterium]|jgi:phosphatidylserine/phosphatidylglycerophosphate/cardiolipin synthase-like enzyme
MKKSLRALFHTALISVVLFAGCARRTVGRALSITLDTTLTCPESATDRCALPSQLQRLADEVMMQPESAEMLHYISVLDIGEDSLLARLHMIRSAKESIILQTFIWDDDEVGQLMFMELLRAARRGVKVRMILDQFGLYVTPKALASGATIHQNIEIKLYRPILKRGGKSATQDIGGAITDVHTLYRRMHNKLLAVDQRIGVLGGRNIQDSYFDHGNKFNFKDLDVLVVGPAVKDMYRSFEMYWEHKEVKSALTLPDIASAATKLKESDYAELFASPELGEMVGVSTRADSYSIIDASPSLELFEVSRAEYIADRPDKKRKDVEPQFASTLRIGEIIMEAEDSLQLQTPYLIQDFKGRQYLRKLRKEKPELEISFSTNSLASADMFFVYAIIFKQRQFNIEGLGANLYEFKPMPGDAHTIIPRFSEIQAEGMEETDRNEDPDLYVPLEFPGPRFIIHAKFFVVDEEVCGVGSHNFDPRAQNLNTENILIIWDEDVAKDLKKIFDRDTSPRNSWVIGRRKKLPVIGNASEFIAAVSSALPIFDIWPFYYSSNFELQEEKEPVPNGHPEFYDNHKNVGVFPKVGFSPLKRIGVFFARAFGGLATGLM